MKKFISLVLALVMALSLTTIAWGAPTTVDVTSNAQLATVLKDTTAQEVVINLSETPSDGTHYIIDLYSNPTVNASIKSLTINGTGTTKVSFDKQQVNASLFSQLTINKCEILHMNTKSWGHLVFGSGVAGGVYTVSNCVFNGTDTQGIYINPDAGNEKYVIEGCTFTGGFGSEGAVTLQNNSEPTDLTVTNNDFDVAAGSEELTVHYHKEALTLNADVDETVLIKAGPDAGTSAEENFAKAVATADAGDTFKLMANVDVTGAEIDKPITINENGNTLTGLTAGSGVTTDNSGKLTSGTFATAPDAADVAANYEVIQLTSGAYSVVPATTGSSTAPLYDLYTATVPAVEVAGDAAYTTVAAVKNEDGSGVLEYVKMDGKLFVKIPANKATINDFYVTAANQKVAQFYLKQIDSVADVTYAFTAVNFTNLGVKCDQMNAAYLDYTANEVGFYLHTSALGVKTYYADGAVTTGAPYYNNAVLATTATNILVGTEIVEAYAFTSNPLNQHVWAPSGYDKTTPVSALCGICGAKANLYTAAKTPASSVIVAVLPVGGTNYNVVMTSAGSYVPSVPSTDKVTSAETFDAGIAMYVGMSVMAAAGSAVVLKKRED